MKMPCARVLGHGTVETPRVRNPLIWSSQNSSGILHYSTNTRILERHLQLAIRTVTHFAAELSSPPKLLWNPFGSGVAVFREQLYGAVQVH